MHHCRLNSLLQKAACSPLLLWNTGHFPFKSQKFSNLAYPGESLGFFIIIMLYLCIGLGMILPCIPKRSCFSSLTIPHASAAGLCTHTQRPAGSRLVFEPVAWLQCGQLEVWHLFVIWMFGIGQNINHPLLFHQKPLSITACYSGFASFYGKIGFWPLTSLLRTGHLHSHNGWIPKLVTLVSL